MSRQHADQVAAALIGAYAATWARLTDAQREAATIAKRTAINSYIAAAKDWLDRLNRATYEWTRDEFSRVYALGANDTLSALGESFSWDAESADQASAIGNDVWESLRLANANVARTLKGVREVADNYGTSTTPEELAQMLARRGASAIVYRGGARHGLEDYATMLLRTQTSLAYNRGTLFGGNQMGVTYYEISDGAGCGLESHSDGSEANGMLVPEDIAATYLISHPNCVRQFSARPDILSAEQAAAEGADDAGAELPTESQLRGEAA